MKTRLRLSILLMLMALANIPTFAVDFEVDGLGYNVISFDEMTCETASCSIYLKNVKIPSTVEYNGRTFTVIGIGDDTFSYCSSVTSVTIPNSVTNIGDYAFYDTSLTSITIPNSVTTIGEFAFSKCSSLASITIPNCVTKIGDHAFYDCSSLKSITIPNSVTTIGKGVFESCSSLASITIPNSVTTIGEYAFYKCSSLASVTIPNSVNSIGDYAFSGCNAIVSITIGKDYDAINVEHINKVILMEDYLGNAPDFSSYKSLNELISLQTVPPSSPNFSNSQIMDLEVLVPTSALSLYQQAEGWKDLWNLKGGAETATGIENVTVSDKVKKSCIYNLNGMKVEHTVPGEIYIKDGKKFIAK